MFVNKKIATFGVVLVCCACLFITGCGKEKYPISNLKLYNEKFYDITFVKGKVRNDTKNDCSSLKIDFEYGTGSLMESDYTYVDDIKAGDTEEIEGVIQEKIDDDELDEYEIKVTKIECESR